MKEHDSAMGLAFSKDDFPVLELAEVVGWLVENRQAEEVEAQKSLSRYKRLASGCMEVIDSRYGQ